MKVVYRKKNAFTSDRWANRMGCKIFCGKKLKALEGEINDWLAKQTYVKVLTSKVVSVEGDIVLVLFYVEVDKSSNLSNYNIK